MDLATAQRIVAQGSRVDRSTWNHAQQTALWLLDRGETPMVLDNDAALQEAVALYERELKRQAALRAELVDWDEREYPGRGGEDDDRRDGATADDRGRRWTEAATGPGSPSR